MWLLVGVVTKVQALRWVVYWLLVVVVVVVNLASRPPQFLGTASSAPD